jgi:fumarate hydratase class II
MSHRKEEDSLGEVLVPKDKYWGAQTQRSLENFAIGTKTMPIEVVYAYAYLKKASAIVNTNLGHLEEEKKKLISSVCEEILEGKLDDQFPLKVFQTGSGTQTNMNVNEVIANRAIEISGGRISSKDPIHPNDHVNMSQSSNDSFPTAMHIAASLLIRKKLLPIIDQLLIEIEKKMQAFSSIIKVGRTHLMDATPLTLSQEFSGYHALISFAKEQIIDSLKPLSEIALGGTAVGTGINAPKGFKDGVAGVLSELTGVAFVSASNKFFQLSSHDAILRASSAIRGLATNLLKIGNDIRFLASGPRCGLLELILPANEPGSSIMPGKVNPTQIEALTMVCVQVMGLDSATCIANSQGNFELNVYKPLMIANLIDSIHLLSDSIESFTERCFSGIKANEKKIGEYLEKSLMLATALNKSIGYDKASRIVKKAYSEDISLKEAALSLKLLTEKEFDEIVDPKKMV